MMLYATVAREWPAVGANASARIAARNFAGIVCPLTRKNAMGAASGSQIKVGGREGGVMSGFLESMVQQAEIFCAGVTKTSLASITPDNASASLFATCGSRTPDNPTIVLHALDCGGVSAVIERETSFGLSAFHCAVGNNKMNSVKVMIAKGCDIEYKAMRDVPPLSFALLHDNRRAMAFLLMDHGAQLNNVPSDILVPGWAAAFGPKRERARRAGIILMGALKRVHVNRDLMPLFGQWVWSTRGCDEWEEEEEEERKKKRVL
jgi:hypothetical protein